MPMPRTAAYITLIIYMKTDHTVKQHEKEIICKQQMLPIYMHVQHAL